MILLVDIGNTRIKWAQLEGLSLGTQSAQPHANWTRDDAIATLTRAMPRPERVLVSNVGGPRMADVLKAAFAEAWQLTPEFAESRASAAGVRNCYSDPTKLGVDRWMAMIGARALEARAVCVVSVGTAMTIDGVDAHGKHLGGVIVPGPNMMVASLLRNTSEIARRAEQGSVDSDLLADNTLGAIMQGATHALAALVERAAETIALEAQQPPTVLLTGGAAARVLQALRIGCKSVPDLVLRGLAVVAQETA
jgi:type III pantothenate kinase